MSSTTESRSTGSSEKEIKREITPEFKPETKAESSQVQATPDVESLAAGDQYPRQDGGMGAWLFLVGACIIEIVAWGFPYCYGVFREYFFTHEPVIGVTYISVAGVMSNGVLQLSLPFVFFFINNFPHHRKTTMWMGCLFCVVSPIGGAFSTTPVQIIVCLGPLYGLGAGMLFGPVMSYNAEWFNKRKSLAYGFICGMGGLSGAVLPPIYTASLNRYGYKTTLIGWSIAVLILTVFGLFFITSRVPVTKALPVKASDFDFFRKPLFWILLTATFVQALAHYVPSTFLPSYASDFGIPDDKGSMLVSFLNLATAFGQPLQGMLADARSSFWVPMVISTFGSGAEVLLIWGFSHTLWALSIFSLLFGATSGGYSVLRPRFATAIVGHDQNKEQSLMIFGVLTAMRGVAIILSGFIASAQLDESLPVTTGYGANKWLRVIVYTGFTMCVASLGLGGKLLKASKNSDSSDEEVTSQMREVSV